jgi:hypothetical protein
MVIYNGVYYDALAMAASPRAADTRPAYERSLFVMPRANHYSGYTKQVMVIYNGVHYDALAIAASPRADQDEDATEYNPRTRRGKMILAAAQQLVRAALESDKCSVSCFWQFRSCSPAHAADGCSWPGLSVQQCNYSSSQLQKLHPLVLQAHADVAQNWQMLHVTYVSWLSAAVCLLRAVRAGEDAPQRQDHAS